MEARAQTTLFYNPTPTEGAITVTVTVTTTATPTPEPLETITLGSPWTTATPDVYTQYGYGRNNDRPRYIVESYPRQPRPEDMPITHYRSYAECRGKKAAAMFFIGFGSAFGLMLLITTVVLIWRWAKRSRRNGQGVGQAVKRAATNHLAGGKAVFEGCLQGGQMAAKEWRQSRQRDEEEGLLSPNERAPIHLEEERGAHASSA